MDDGNQLSISMDYVPHHNDNEWRELVDGVRWGEIIEKAQANDSLIVPNLLEDTYWLPEAAELHDAGMSTEGMNAAEVRLFDAYMEQRPDRLSQGKPVTSAEAAMYLSGIAQKYGADSFEGSQALAQNVHLLSTADYHGFVARGITERQLATQPSHGTAPPAVSSAVSEGGRKETSVGGHSDTVLVAGAVLRPEVRRMIALYNGSVPGAQNDRSILQPVPKTPAQTSEGAGLTEESSLTPPVNTGATEVVPEAERVENTSDSTAIVRTEVKRGTRLIRQVAVRLLGKVASGKDILVSLANSASAASADFVDGSLGLLPTREMTKPELSMAYHLGHVASYGPENLPKPARKTKSGSATDRSLDVELVLAIGRHNKEIL